MSLISLVIESISTMAVKNATSVADSLNEDESGSVDLSIVIPVFNEVENLEPLLDEGELRRPD